MTVSQSCPELAKGRQAGGEVLVQLDFHFTAGMSGIGMSSMAEEAANAITARTCSSRMVGKSASMSSISVASRQAGQDGPHGDPGALVDSAHRRISLDPSRSAVRSPFASPDIIVTRPPSPSSRQPARRSRTGDQNRSHKAAASSRARAASAASSTSSSSRLLVTRTRPPATVVSTAPCSGRAHHGPAPWPAPAAWAGHNPPG